MCNNCSKCSSRSKARFKLSVCYCRAELNSTLARQQLDLVSNVVLPPCRTQFIDYKYIRIHLKVCSTISSYFFIFVFCFRQQPFYSTELNSTSETKSCQCVMLQSSSSRRAAQQGSSVTFETGLSVVSVVNVVAVVNVVSVVTVVNVVHVVAVLCGVVAQCSSACSSCSKCSTYYTYYTFYSYYTYYTVKQYIVLSQIVIIIALCNTCRNL